MYEEDTLRKNGVSERAIALRTKRQALRITQKQLAAAIGCHVSLVSGVELGDRTDEQSITVVERFLAKHEEWRK